jgi:CelD/BcsL family acetyltransferase involved in cellulose biosynthesis
MSVPSIAFYPPLAPAALGRRRAKSLPYPLDGDDCVVVSRGRHAIWLAAQALGLGPGASVLAPAWHHGAEIEALRSSGARVDLYDLDDELAPDPDELAALAGPRTRALVITHYLGFPQDAARWRAWCDERGLLLIEDAAHACLARGDTGPVGSLGDAAIWCLFKSFSVPDGAALRLARPARYAPGSADLGASATARRQAQWILQRAPMLAKLLDGRSGASGHYDHQAEIALGDAQAAPLAATTWLLPRVADLGAATRRRANYATLLDELGETVPPPFDRLPEGAVPLGFPITCADKAGALRRLGAAGIDAVDFWSEGHPLAGGRRFPRADALRRSTVLLPVHQELRPVDLERVAAAARGRRAAADELRVEITDDIAELAPEWSRLAWRTGNVFATPEWADSWCRYFLDARPLRLFAFRNGTGRLVAVLPTYVFANRPLHVLRLVGHGPGDELGPVCDPADRMAVGRALRRGLRDAGADLLLAEHVAREPAWSALTGGVLLRSGANPVIRVAEPDWQAFVATRSRRLRKELRRAERRLARDPALRVRDGVSAALDEDLTALFELHAARWNGGESKFGNHRDFHRDFAHAAAERGWLRLVFLEAAGRTVAATYGFRYGHVELDYQGGRDPGWTGGSPGSLLLGWMVREAFEAGISEYRLLRGGERYKLRLATHDAGLETFAVASGARGSTAAAIAAHLPHQLADPLRRRLQT